MGLIAVPKRRPIFKPIGMPQIDREHPVSHGLVVHLGMFPYEFGGKVVHDLSGNGNVGAFGVGAASPSWTSDKYGPAVDFDGGDTINCGTKSSVMPDAWTIIAGVKPNAAGTWMPLIGWASGEVHFPAVLLEGFGGGKPVIYLGGENYRYFPASSFTLLSNGDSHVVAFTCPGSAQTDILSSKMFIDGIDQGTDGTDSSAAGQTAKSQCWIGYNNAKYLTGDIAFLYLYNHVWNPSEIAQLSDDPLCNIIYPRKRAMWVIKPAAGEEALTASVYDEITVTESITALLPLLLADVSDSVTVNESVTPLMPLLLSTLFDTVGVTESITPLMPLLQMEVSDSVSVTESVAPLMPLLEASVYDSISVSEDVQAGKGGWIGITSAHLDSDSGSELVHPLEDALDGSDYCEFSTGAPWWFILDLGSIQHVSKVRSWSNLSFDPIDVDIYVNNTGEAPWGEAVASGITTFKDTTDWVEINTVGKNGRYVRVVANESEQAPDVCMWGGTFPSIGIFDVYGVLVPDLLTASVSDSISVAEDISTHLPLLEANVSDSITVSESIEATLPLYEVLEYDTITVAESVALENALLTASLYDSIAVAELVSAYFFTMWTRVTGDNDVTWQNRPDSNSMTWQNPTDSNDVDWRNV